MFSYPRDPKKRRPSGDGMVRKREDGHWEGRIVIGHKENGDPIFRYTYASTQIRIKESLGWMSPVQYRRSIGLVG